MKDITLSVYIEEVWEYVKKSSNYSGSKTEEDFTKVALTDADQKAWQEMFSVSLGKVTSALKELVKTDWIGGGREYVMRLSVSESYDNKLTDNVRFDVSTFVENDMVAQWYRVANKSEADEYQNKADTALMSAIRKLYYRKKPSRPKRRFQ